MLAIFWPKKSIIGFFKDCSVPAVVLKQLETGNTQELSRAAIIERVFDTLGKQPDNGTMHFEQMLEALAAWTYFDPYWFDSQQKLSLEEARRQVAALNTAKRNHVDRSKKIANDHRAKEAERQQRYNSLEEMRTDFNSISMGKVKPQKRGFELEKFLAKMARFYGLQVTDAFRIEGAQIDGSVKYDGENYNIEAKWHDRALSNEPLLAFCRKLEINMHGRGIFISINGYSEDALSILERAGIKNSILMDGEDIILILNDMLTLPEALDKKVGAAQTKGQFYIHPITGDSKVKSK